VKLRVVFAGTPTFAVPALSALAARHAVCGVMTQPDRPAGRGQQLTASPVAQFAASRTLPIIQPQRLRGDAAVLTTTLAQLAAWQPDVIVVVAYGLILPRDVLVLPRLGCLNIHASLLPRWRGAAPIQRALQAGDATTGVSIMQMDEGLDTGAVLAERPLAIAADDTAGTLHDRLAELGADLLLEVLDALQAGTAAAQAQPASGVSYASKLSKTEARIDWHGSAVQIDRQIRAFNPWPIAEAKLQDEGVKLLMSRVAHMPVTTATAHPPGTVMGLRDEALQVACGQGVLEVLQLQRPGRRPVTAREFLNAGRRASDAAALVFE
jgi:methionyl-tRNA formyltransferase